MRSRDGQSTKHRVNNKSVCLRLSIIHTRRDDQAGLILELMRLNEQPFASIPRNLFVEYAAFVGLSVF